MDTSSAPSVAASRLRALTGFLRQDPDNLSLLAETASAALDAGDLATLFQTIARYETLAPVPPALRAVEGVGLLSGRRYDEAEIVFARLLAEHPDDPTLRFNLAWARGRRGDHDGALEALPPEAASASATAATLRVQTLHRLGRPDEATDEGAALFEIHRDPRLAAALALAATDAERSDDAHRYAQAAGDHPDGLSTLGALALADNQLDAARAYYDRALGLAEANPRALLGKGLVLLVSGQGVGAERSLTRSAEIFDDHPGAWIAAGWARFINGDLAGSRAAFDRALAADDAFAESHGGLAVLDAVEQRLDDAERRAEVALRLDRACFSAALAKSLIAAAKGDDATAVRVREMALNAPIGPDKRTIAGALVALGLARGD